MSAAGVPLARRRSEVFVLKSITILLTCSLAVIPVCADAQPTTAVEPVSAWQITAGRDVASLRDISGTGVPVDASPVSWRGTGIGIFGRHTREQGRWRQEFAGALTRVSSFRYEVGDTTLQRPADDRFTGIGAHYELHRRLFSDLAVQGLSVSAGVRVGASRSSVARHMPIDITATETRLSGVTAFLMTVGFHRGRGPGIDVAWANGGHIGRISARHSSDDLSRAQWGGGWLSDLAIEGDLPIGGRTSIVARYLISNDGSLSSHRSVASARSSLMLGVAYGR